MEKFNILLVDDVSENIYSLKMMIEDSFDVNILDNLVWNLLKISNSKIFFIFDKNLIMPEISRFYGIIIYMFFNDHNPPHFKVKYNEFEANA